MHFNDPDGFTKLYSRKALMSYRDALLATPQKGLIELRSYDGLLVGGPNFPSLSKYLGKDEEWIAGGLSVIVNEDTRDLFIQVIGDFLRDNS